jgi:hypothetical protein
MPDQLYKVSWKAGQKLFHASSEKEARAHAAEYLSQEHVMKVELGGILWEEKEDSVVRVPQDV